jgi:hypothetical protein
MFLCRNDLHYASFVIKIIQFTQFEPFQKYVFIAAKNNMRNIFILCVYNLHVLFLTLNYMH